MRKRIELVHLVDVTAIAAAFGVKPDTVHHWRRRGLGFPEPVKVLAIGPMWHMADVSAWYTARRL